MTRCFGFHHPPRLIYYQEASFQVSSNGIPYVMSDDVQSPRFSSSSMSLIEKTMNLLFMSPLVGLFIKPDQVPWCILKVLERGCFPPHPYRQEPVQSQIEAGGSVFEKSESGVMSLSAYVSLMARSIIASSSGVNPLSIILKARRG